MPASILTLSRRHVLLTAALGPLYAAPKQLRMAGISFDVIANGRSTNRYLHIHGNEQTAREVLREHMRTHKGIATMVVGEARLVAVGECAIDPNRMFSDEGARKSLERFNKEKPAAAIEAALDLLRRDREKFVKAVAPPKGGRLIAMHNNSEGYSIKDEVELSDNVSMPDDANPRDFMLATNAEDYEAIAKGKYNVVLQKSVRTEDGSFSVLAAHRGIRYVNIEAALGSGAKQKAMLEFLEVALIAAQRQNTPECAP